MSKKPKRVQRLRPETIWQYECNIPEEGKRGAPGWSPAEVVWIPEDDERSASYKAIRPQSTGRIRSKIINDAEDRGWEIKVQNMLPWPEGREH